MRRAVLTPSASERGAEDAVNGLTETFRYDGLDRLVRAQATTDDPGRPAAYRAETAYAYDARGNILSRTGVGTYAYDAATGRLAPVDPPPKTSPLAKRVKRHFRRLA